LKTANGNSTGRRNAGDGVPSALNNLAGSLWRLPERLTVSQWADRYRLLDSRAASEPGRWKTSRTPYLREIMDSFNDPAVREITIMGGAQVAKTSAVENMLCYCIDWEPCPVMYTLPDQNAIERIVKNRLEPMLRNNPRLAGHIPSLAYDLKKSEFYLDQMTIYFGYSGSPQSLATISAKVVIKDELDKFSTDKSAESSAADLADHRAETYWDSKIVSLCTPTTKEGNINVAFEAGTMEQYYMPCPLCGEYLYFAHGGLKWPQTWQKPSDVVAEQIYYECPACRGHIFEAHKFTMLPLGKWAAAGQRIDKSGVISGKAVNKRSHRSFHLTGFMSPWKKWSSIASAWMSANSPYIDAVKVKNYFNSIIGMPYDETAIETDRDKIKQNIAGHSRGTVPADCLALVAGADYHEDERGNARIDYEIRGFSYNEVNYVVDAGSVTGTSEEAFYKLADTVLAGVFPWADGTRPESRPYLSVSCLLVDSGYMPDKVYEFCGQYPGLCYPSKGASGRTTNLVSLSEPEKGNEDAAKKRRKKSRRNIMLMTIDTNFFKSKVHAWASKPAGEPASTAFFEQIDNRYFIEFTNEHQVQRGKGANKELVWEPVRTGAPTHSLDTAVLCAAAAYYKMLHHKKKHIDKRMPTAAGKRPRPAAVAAAEGKRQEARGKTAPKARRIRTRY
jgi:phage terminase large subunit GpA-like protein